MTNLYTGIYIVILGAAVDEDERVRVAQYYIIMSTRACYNNNY